jgi:hypothetical protein
MAANAEARRSAKGEQVVVIDANHGLQIIPGSTPGKIRHSEVHSVRSHQRTPTEPRFRQWG